MEKSTVTEKKAEALPGTGFLSTNYFSEKHEAFLSLGYSYDNRKSNNYNGHFSKSGSCTLAGKAEAQEGKKLLGNTTVKVSTFPQVVRKYRKYVVLNSVKSIMEGTGFRVESCMKAVGKEVRVQKTGAVYHYGGVITCGSVWVCPVCASRITEKRKQELQEALDTSGFFPVLVTVTLAHKRSDALSNLLNTLNTSLRKLKAGRWWQNFAEKYGVKAHVSSLEFTYSTEKGFHPHKHLLFFLESADADIQEFKKELTERYLYLVQKEGGYASAFHAIDVQAGASGAGVYLAKWGVVAEVTKSNLKEAKQEGSFSMWQLAELGESEAWARQAFLEYAYATYGKKAITYSHGARKALGMNKEKTDAELAEVETEVITTISRKAWKCVLLIGAQAGVLILAETKGKEAVDKFIQVLLDTFGFT